jgi:hypothetical protein
MFEQKKGVPHSYKQKANKSNPLSRFQFIFDKITYVHVLSNVLTLE